MQDTEDKRIIKNFRLRQTRQIIAVAAAMFLVLLMAVLHKRPDIFGEFSRQNLFIAQAAVISSFAGFTAYNWRCPSCKKYLGSNILRDRCRKCGTRLR